MRSMWGSIRVEARLGADGGAEIKIFALIWKNRENKGKDRFSTPYGEAAERAGLRQ